MPGADGCDASERPQGQESKQDTQGWPWALHPSHVLRPDRV